MIKYKLSYTKASSHYIDFSCEFDVSKDDEVELQFPAWRPGRYELGNFAKNIQYFKVFDENRQPLNFHKISKDSWKVDTASSTKIEVRYNYYAFELNAGSSYLDDQQLYVNPVNCFVYIRDRVDEACQLELDVPESYQVAIGLGNPKDRVFETKDYHELVDSPFIASASLQHHQFKSCEVDFHLWFQGECQPDWKKLERDFKAYTVKQVEAFGQFPVKEYHYLFQISPKRAYHGVEHLTSTVIYLGPGSELMEGRYTELLGVSSHELYHAWNIKSIRPSEMFPYDYSQENYSRMGYVAEGVTTYLGDLFLLKGKVFSVEQYLKELNTQLQRHFDNPGRFNMSVADSSFDTWLDGYVAGAPGRKVSIYTEGCLLAFVLDTMIMRASNNEKSIHDVMYRLYHDYALNNKPYDEAIYKAICEEVSGLDLSDYFDNYVNGTSTYEGLLNESLDYLGLELRKEKNSVHHESLHGFKLSGTKIVKIAPGSPADVAGLSIDDEIIKVNHVIVGKDAVKWLNYFNKETPIITVNRDARELEIQLTQVDMDFFRKYSAVQIEEPSRAQRTAFNKWSSKKK